MNDLESFLRKLTEEPGQIEQPDSLTEREGEQGTQCNRTPSGYEKTQKLSNPYTRRRFRRFNLLPPITE